MVQELDFVLLSLGGMTESERRKALEDCRWPDGFVCPRCGAREGTALRTRPLIQCRTCRYQVSATAGTQLHNNHTSFEKLFRAIKSWLVHENGSNIGDKAVIQAPGAEKVTTFLMKLMNVTYKTARRFRKILQWDNEDSDEPSSPTLPPTTPPRLSARIDGTRGRNVKKSASKSPSVMTAKVLFDRKEFLIVNASENQPHQMIMLLCSPDYLLLSLRFP